MEESISFNVGKKVSLAHNNRVYENHSNPDIDSSKSGLNIEYVKNNLKDFYNQEFATVVDEYNQKQKRNDRKIKNYYDKIANDEKTSLAREVIVQIGKAEDIQSTSDWKRRQNILDEYARNFQKRNPNLRVVNSVMHLDESTPHLHITFVPVYHANRGLKKRVSFTKAIQEQLPGVPKKFMKFWTDRERDEIERITKQHVPDFKRKKVGSHKYLEVPEYKQAMKATKELEADYLSEAYQYNEKLTDLQVKNHELSVENNDLQNKIEHKKSELLELDNAISDKKELVRNADKQVELEIEKIKNKTKPYELKLLRISKMTEDFSNFHFYSDKDDLYQKVGKYLPNRFGTDREEKAVNILELMNKARLSSNVEEVMDENIKLRTERDKVIDKAVETATSPLKQKIKKQEAVINSMQKWIDSVKESLHSFKHIFGEKYREFLTDLGVRFKSHSVRNARGIAQDKDEMDLINKGFSKNVDERYRWKMEHDPTPKSMPLYSYHKNKERGR